MIKDRVVQIIEYKGIKKEDFFSKIGMTSANFRGEAKKTPLNSTAIENILSELPDINVEWLITGKEPMIKGDVISQCSNSQEGIPLIPLTAMAGAFTMASQVLEYECERFVIPTFKGADFLIPVKGSSMYPKYSSGDIVACKKLPIDTFFQWNKVYVIDTDQGPLIKRINKGNSDDTIMVVSENEKYPPFELHRSHIYNIAIVLGVIRLE